MRSHRRDRVELDAVGGQEGGFATVQYVALVGLSLVLLVLFANLLVDVYARGVIRDALDEGVRAGAPVGAPPEACEHAASEVVGALLRGPIGDDLTIRCESQGGSVRATARGSLPSWFPGLVPDWSVELDAFMRAER